MKLYSILLTLFFAFNANAGLITTQADKDSYTAGETITVDFFVNDANPSIDFLQFDFGFDDSQFSFIDFSWMDSDEIYNFGASGDAYLASADELYLDVALLDGFAAELGTSFRLGHVQFEALVDSASPEFALLDQFVSDINFVEIPVEQHQVSVPEPSTLAFFPLLAAMFWVRRKVK